MMRFSRHLAVDAGAGHVAGGVFSAGPAGRLVLEEFALETRTADPSLEPGWLERTAEALGSMAARRRWRGPAALAVPGHLMLTKFINTPAVAPAQREKVIRFEAAQNLPCPLEAVAWDYLVVAGDGLDLEIMLTAVKLEVMENLCAAAEAAGFPVKRAAASCLALHRALRFNYPQVAAPVLVVDIGARSTNLVLAEPGGRFFARTFLLGGNAVTAAVAEELPVDFAQAETLKLQASASSADRPVDATVSVAVERAARNFIGRLQLEIMRTSGNFSLRTGAAPPVIFYLTGGGSLLAGLSAALRVKFSVGVERYDPLRNVELSVRARAAGAADATHLLANLVGLAVPMTRTAGAESGLLPPTVRATREFRRRQPVRLGAVTLLALALLPPLWHFHRLASAQGQQAAAIGAQLPQLRDRAERNAAQLAKIALAQGQFHALQNLADARTSWANFLADLQGRLGRIEDVWLDQLTVMRPPAARSAGSVIPVPATQLRLRGRLLDALHPDSKVSADSHARVKALLASCASAPGIAAIGDERFDNSLPGLLCFDFTLTVNPQQPL